VKLVLTAACEQDTHVAIGELWEAVRHVGGEMEVVVGWWMVW
jgi:hypothetical protein